VIELSDAAKSVLLAGSQRHLVRVESWLDDELLADDIPISAGREEGDRSLAVPERATLTVPRTADGVDWSPDADLHPLAANGQRLRVNLGVELANGVVEWIQRGEFLVFSSEADGDTVTVESYGLLWLVSEARLVSPYQPSGTLISTLRGLIEPALTVVVDAGLTDRSVPAGVNYDEDRLGAVGELLDAWPAVAQVQPEGYLLVEADVTPTVADLALLSTGAQAVVINRTGTGTRDGFANVIVARGTAADGGQLQGVAYDVSTGPRRYGGEANPLPVPTYFTSPLLTTVAQCNAAANTVLARRQRQAQQPFTVVIPPRPDIVLGDAVSVDGLLCTVENLTLPYVPGDTTGMPLTLRQVPS
jgi:hypothetical protein